MKNQSKSPLNTFQKRYVLPFLGVLAIAVAIFVWLTLNQQGQLLDSELLKKGKTITEELAEISNINILLDDIESLKSNVSLIVGSDEDVSDAAIFNASGEIMISYDSTFRLQEQIALTDYSETNLETEWLFVMPIYDNTEVLQGTAVVRISRDRVLHILQQSALTLVLTTVILFLIIAFVVYWLLTQVKSMAEQEIQRAKEIEVAYIKLQNLQNDLRQANETLEENVEQRTKALGRTNNDLQKVNKELKDFAYIISHDLKAPLRAISSLTGWIIEDYQTSFDEDGQEQMNLLQDRVTRMYQLLEGILRYSRIGTGKEELEILELNELVKQVIAVLLPSQNFEISIENELPSVYADRTKVHQIFQNIISNAIKYNDKPVGKVKISSGTDKEKGTHYFSISDNGKGIPEEDFDRVFKIFQTLEKDKNSAESTGVGLTLVQKIVKKYGGNISVKSKVGEGTTFTFSMPMVD